MSLGGEDVRKTEELPGAFPSEDAITKSELNNTTTTSGTTPAGTQHHTKPYPEHNLGAHQNVAQAGGANNSNTPLQSQNIAHTTAAAGAGSTASPADSDPDHLLRRAGAEGTGGAVGRGSAQPSSLSSAANPLSGPAVGDDESTLGPENAPDITSDLKAVGSGAATAATAAAIAARDAAVAVKDAAAPVVGAASEQVRQTFCIFLHGRMMADLLFVFSPGHASRWLCSRERRPGRKRRGEHGPRKRKTQPTNLPQ